MTHGKNKRNYKVFSPLEVIPYDDSWPGHEKTVVEF